MSKVLKVAADPSGMILKKDNPYGMSQVISGDKDEGLVAAGAAAPNAAAAEALQEKQVATREQDLRAAAAAAGATRSGNQRDWLSGGPVRAKRKDAAKALLGE